MTIEPFAPNKRTGFLVLFETDRRREEGWQATGYGDELPGIESGEDSPLLSSDFVGAVRLTSLRFWWQQYRRDSSRCVAGIEE